ncbi:GNAT family N-acetyltransferase [Nocardiopsis sp. N85]|uniref:GNAT family N-acetyltransferase n=1 Tax=Nocardiopsis sp. N85 TaxID=3029400 RepID=UPI00237FD40B|nr:GNAT family N-acetyltransferase [Nocardiopsis sp. N85]MDE3722166.1 GNAT family N-acetyltransferase [Nocardiopsis sp. N85]
MSPVVEVFDPLTAAPAELAAWSAAHVTGRRELSGSAPEADELAERLGRGRAGRAWRWAGRMHGEGPILGTAELRRQPHDAGIGFLRLFVEASARRNGMGTLLRSEAAARARAEGMSRLQSTVPAGRAGEAFARTSPHLRTLLHLELQVQPFDDETLRHCRRLASTPRRGYRITHWVGRAPEPLLPSYGRVMDHLLDAPGSAFQEEPRRWGPQDVRAWELRMTEDGSRLLVGAVVDRTSDQVVAATVCTVTRGPVADQHDTAVLPAHRRRGLASRVKATQTLRVHENFPHVQAMVVTLNRENTAMLEVNRLLGYEKTAERLLVEDDLTSRG